MGEAFYWTITFSTTVPTSGSKEKRNWRPHFSKALTLETTSVIQHLLLCLCTEKADVQLKTTCTNPKHGLTNKLVPYSLDSGMIMRLVMM